MLKELARNCMTKVKFNSDGILHLSKLINLLAESFHLNGDGSSRGVYLKIIQGLVGQNWNCGHIRLGPDILKEFIITVSKLGKVGASWAIWSQHNKVLDCPSLDIDTEEPLLIARCLPRFLTCTSADVRLTAGQYLRELSTSSLLPFLQNVLIPATKASFEYHSDKEYIKHSIAGSNTGLLVSMTSLS